MALVQSFKNPAAVNVEYWKIGNFNFSQTGSFVDIQMLGYVNQTTRLAGKDHVEIKKIRVVFDKFNQYFSPAQMDAANANVLAIAYNYIKQNEPFFIGSTDLI